MSQVRGCRPSPIERLPVELVRMILPALPDVQSLHAATLSCPLFYRAFLEAETIITTQALLNQIDASVLPEASAALKSSSLCPHDTGSKSRQAIEEFVAQNLRQRPDLLRFWPLRTALRLGRFHAYVEALANRFATEALHQPPLSQSRSTATHEEICRIQRTFYRFEIYCNLFRGSPKAQPSVYGEQRRLFFANFAPWENEQLGCVHDFLDRAVSPAFNDIAEHDVAWGAFRVPYDQEVGSPHIQRVLSLGLEKLHQIAAAETYEERYLLLNASKGPSSTSLFLHEGLQDANDRNSNIFLDDLGPDDEARYIRKPFFVDPDPGPADIWRWAHQEESTASWLYQENRRSLRQWGYVLWDRSRLDAIGILHTQWEDPESPSDLLLREQEAGRQWGYMGNSWEKRERIHRMGGFGWWSWGDESKVSWKGGRKPRQGRSVQALIKPNSLQEAREALAKMKLPLPAI